MTKCDLCGNDVEDYVVLNRWATVSGNIGTMISGPYCYRWVPRNGQCSGTRLCVPGCLCQWVEAQLVETGVRRKQA